MYPKERNRKSIVVIELPRGCHVCTSYKIDETKGYLYSAKRGVKGLHRFIYEQVHGAIPRGKVIMHTCDKRDCINITHLKMGSAEDNRLDMIAKGRGVKGTQQHLAKLNDNKVKKILESNKSNIFLAKQYNVTTTTIRGIKNRYTWKHVEARK